MTIRLAEQSGSRHALPCSLLSILGSAFFPQRGEPHGTHQLPPQPLQFPALLLHHPDAQLPPQELDHLQQLGAGAGVVVGAGAGQARPGWVMPSVISGVSPRVHTQLGSPSSSPLVLPSPSESILQMISSQTPVYCSWKSIPN